MQSNAPTFIEAITALIDERVAAALKNVTPERRIIPIAEACKRYDLSRATLWRLVKDGKLTATKIGARVLLNIDELEGRTKARQLKRKGV